MSWLDGAEEKRVLVWADRGVQETWFCIVSGSQDQSRWVSLLLNMEFLAMNKLEKNRLSKFNKLALLRINVKGAMQVTVCQAERWKRLI